jgi:outer membrane immunogenic protein
MKKLLASVSLAALALGIGGAHAADLVRNPPTINAPAMQAFNGFYAGVELGVVSTQGQIDDVNPNYANVAGFQNVTPANGFLLGGQVGYDFRLGDNFVLGVGADVKGLFTDDAGCAAAGCAAGANGSPNLSYNINGLASLTGKAGVVIADNMLVYGLAGLAAGKVTTNHYDNSPEDITARTFTGYVIGIGAETMVSDNVSLGVEGRYYNLGSQHWTDRVNEKFGAAPTAFTLAVTSAVHF